MGIARTIGTLPVLALAACQSASTFDPAVPGARPIAYEAIRDGSGVLGYAESLLGPDLATTYQGRSGPGAHGVDPSRVAGAWELPAGTRPGTLAAALREHGALADVRDRADGQVWIADYRGSNAEPLRLLFIDGNSPAFQTNAAPEVRPSPHVYLIAYRLR